MILVRQVFQVKYGYMDKILEYINSAPESVRSASNVHRVLTDISGPNFTLVLETKAESLEAYWRSFQAMFQNPDVNPESSPLTEYVESGYKEFYTIEYEAGS